MIGFVLGLVFAAGVALVFLHFAGVRVSTPRGSRLGASLTEADLPWTPALFSAAVVLCGVLAGAFAWLIVKVPALTVAAMLGGAFGPVAWVRSRRERIRRERERAWPAVLGQLADALEGGLAFRAAVALVADSGPMALRGDFAAFGARLRGTDIATAIEGVRRPGDRTTDSVVLLLRAALEFPTGGLAPVLRELADVLAERLEAREKARARSANLNLEALILAVSPIAILLLIGVSSPGFLKAYRTAAGTAVALICGALIFGCYLLMRRLGRVPEPRTTRPQGKM